jgi:glycosyltransferase involved in cell wall biosynthesis
MIAPPAKVAAKVAVWLQLEPGQELRGEGIGEHLMRLLKGLKEEGSRRPVVFAPRWAGRVVRGVLAEHDLQDFVEVRLFGAGRPRIPFLGPIVRTVARPFKPLLRLLRPRKAPVGDPLPYWYTRRIVDAPALLLLAPLALLLAPFVLLFWLPLRLARMLYARSTRLQHYVERLRGLRSALAYAEMARAIDNDPAIGGAIVPIGNWEYCRYIEQKPIVVQIPDIVFMEFPQYFQRDKDALAAMERIRYVARHAQAIVCPSQYVKATHLVRGLGVPEEKVFVVHHAPMRLDEEFKAACAALGLPADKGGAVRMLRDFQRERMLGAGYLGRVNGSAYWLSHARDPAVWDRPKLYYPTQYRPYKNIENVIRAVQRLRDERGIVATLLLTADLAPSPEAFRLVEEHGLHDQVIPLPRVPAHIHGALYKAADLALTASSFEGGFPFMLPEAHSQGTPCIMARIPVAMERLRGPIVQRMTFDPDDVDELVEVIARGLADEKLVERQVQTMQMVFGDRTWRNVAREYLAALDFASRRRAFNELHAPAPQLRRAP